LHLIPLSQLKSLSSITNNHDDSGHADDFDCKTGVATALKNQSVFNHEALDLGSSFLCTTFCWKATTNSSNGELLPMLFISVQAYFDKQTTTGS
jgi:hypothetical protein